MSRGSNQGTAAAPAPAPSPSTKGRTHVVEITYKAGTVAVEPAKVRVARGDKLRFKRKGGGKGVALRITFANPDALSAPEFREGDAAVEVVKNLTGSVAFRCELVPLKDSGDLGTGPVAGGSLEPIRRLISGPKKARQGGTILASGDNVVKQPTDSFPDGSSIGGPKRGRDA